MENVSAFSDLSWYIGPALVAARVTTHWNQQRSTNVDSGLLTVPNILGRRFAFGSIAKEGCDIPVPSVLPETHQRTEAVDERADHQLVPEIGGGHEDEQRALLNDVDRLFRVVRETPKNNRQRSEALQMRSAPQQRVHSGVVDASPPSPKDAMHWTSLWLKSSAWSQPIIWDLPVKALTPKVTRLTGPGNGLAVRSSPVFIYPSDCQAGNATVEFIVCFNMTGGLSLATAETALRARKIIGDEKLLETDQNRPEVFLASAAKVGAYEIATATESVEVFICRFQPEHVGHRGCLAAGFSYFLCGLSSGSPPYRVVATGFSGQTRFVLSRSYAGDCPRLPLFHCHFNENSSSSSNNNNSNNSNNNVVKNNNANSNSNSSCGNSVAEPKISPNEFTSQGVMGEKANPGTGSDSSKGRPRMVPACGVGPDGQLVPIARPFDTIDPLSTTSIVPQETNNNVEQQHAKQANGDDKSNCSIAAVPETGSSAERSQTACSKGSGDESQLPGSVLEVCVLNCIERKSQSAMLREMAVLLNDERYFDTIASELAELRLSLNLRKATSESPGCKQPQAALWPEPCDGHTHLNNRTPVTFDLRVCGLCAPSRALLNETRTLRRQAIAHYKQQASTVNEGKVTVENNVCLSSAPEKRPEKLVSSTRSSPEVAKYFNQRYRLISRFKNDLHLSEEAWFSICPEEIGKHIARRVAGLSRLRGGRLLRIMDPCCGAGGNAVQCAAMSEIEHVYANDLKEHEIASARRLAALYGVAHKITFSCGDLFKLRSEDVGDIDALVFSPPWGGPEYLGKPTFDISEMTPSYSAILRHCSHFSTNMAVLLPRNVCLDQLASMAEELGASRIETADAVAVELELNLIGKKCKTATVYYGELVNRMTHQG